MNAPTESVRQPTMDIVVVTCRRDLHLMVIMLKSIVSFSKLNGSLLIFCDEIDKKTIEDMDLPPKCRIISKQSVVGTGADDFKVQMYIKLNVFQFSDADYVWSIDSDYIFISDVYIDDFLRDEKPIWQYRDWDNEPSMKWRPGTEKILGFDPDFQYMDRPIYVFDRNVLYDLSVKHDLSAIINTDVLPSEYMIYGAFAHRFHPSAHYWWNPADNEKSIVYSVNQRPPTYCVIDPGVKLRDAGLSKYCVFWSHWDQSEFKMREFLRHALERSIESTPILDYFYPPLSLKEIVEDGFRKIGYQYDDNWLHPSVLFCLSEVECGFLCLSIYVPDISRVYQCVIFFKESVAHHHLVNGANLIKIPLNHDQPNRIRLEFKGCRYAADGSFYAGRQISAVWAGAYFSIS